MALTGFENSQGVEHVSPAQHLVETLENPVEVLGAKQVISSLFYSILRLKKEVHAKIANNPPGSEDTQKQLHEYRHDVIVRNQSIGDAALSNGGIDVIYGEGSELVRVYDCGYDPEGKNLVGHHAETGEVINFDPSQILDDRLASE